MWKDVKGYEGLYAVNDEGAVFSFKSRREITPMRNGHGALQVQLYKDGHREVFSVARLVADTFMPIEKNIRHPKVVHLNGDLQDNRLENLKWATYANGSFERDGKRMYKRPIWVVDTLTDERFRCDSVSEASELTSVSRASIYACLNRKKDVVKGYRFFMELRKG